MRWGVLFNLAVILFVSGFLLFVVFSASLQRVVIDEKMRHTALMGEIVAEQLTRSAGLESLKRPVAEMCRKYANITVVLYSPAGKPLLHCGRVPDIDPPGPLQFDQNVRVLNRHLPAGLFHGMMVVVDIHRPFPYKVSTVRTVYRVPATVFTPAWRFFGAYLLLTQAALFFLGYFLFHRTVIGPIREVARMAGKASGLTEQTETRESRVFRGDIQKISAGLRAMIVKIVEDRENTEQLVTQLRQTNRELEAAQQGLVRSEKLAGVGRLAAGLAHEIGNPLQIAMGYAELLQRGANDPRLAADIPQRMLGELRRIHDILTKLLAFARPHKEDISPCDFNRLTAEAESLLQGRKAFRDIDFRLDLDPDLPITETEPEKVRQILVNLLFNAADAVSREDGVVTLRTHCNDRFVFIEVEDNGHGIAEQDIEKVFDPFFTTKEPGKGTGLGLAVCLSLVESLRGSIEIRSSQGQGTTVSVALPRTDEYRFERQEEMTAG